MTAPIGCDAVEVLRSLENGDVAIAVRVTTAIPDALAATHTQYHADQRDDRGSREPRPQHVDINFADR